MGNTHTFWVSRELDYSPFGMGMVGRSWSGGSEYRYGFNDARLGRRWNLDRINKLWESAYLAFENCPILFKDTRGLSSEIGSTSNQSEQLVSHKTGLDYRGKKSDMLELSPLPAPTRESKWDKKEANSLISNSANVIWASPKLNCEMCCLSALASNLNVLYNKSFSGDFDDMVQSTGNIQ